MLDNQEALPGDVLLATIVMLRIYEQMNDSSDDEECHISGASALLSSLPTFESLGRAALWVYLRQDVYMAVLNHRPIKTDVALCWQWMNQTPSNDCEWSHLIVLIIVDIIQFCFSSPSTGKLPERWHVLRDKIQQWQSMRPVSFDPYFFKERNGSMRRYFPEIWLWDQCHVLANIYYHMGSTLLLAYEPVCVIGIAARRKQKMLELQAKEHARAVCGICLSNPTSETRRTASYAMHLCCRYITDPNEQEAVVQLLERIETEEAWPTSRVIEALNEEWAGLSD
ncbi:hypothetical protein AYO22_06788 [Fonsecaea multimorphosa]|nr:hypothetical protein AYO22_06788 [Fonsecaea multimorphosa]